jgi:hypothetical protein
MLKRKSYLYVVGSAAIAAVVMMGPALALQTHKTRIVSDELREKCRAQVRAIGIRGMTGGGSAERQRDAIMRQCLASRGRL